MMTKPYHVTDRERRWSQVLQTGEAHVSTSSDLQLTMTGHDDLETTKSHQIVFESVSTAHGRVVEV